MSCYDLRQCSKEFLTEFIEMYKGFPCLWKIKSKDYSNRQKRSAAYNVLITKFKEVDPHANRETVVKKINSLRTVYKKELTKVRQSALSGNGYDDLYRPNLWYYDLFEFLDDQEISRTPCETIIEEDEIEMDLESARTSTPSADDDGHGPRPNHDVMDAGDQAYTPAKRKCIRDKIDKMVDRITNSSPEYYSSNLIDKYSDITKVWTDKLRNLDRNQLIFAEKAINDVLFEAELGNLSRDSVKINEKFLCRRCYNFPTPHASSCHETFPAEQTTPRRLIPEQKPSNQMLTNSLPSSSHFPQNPGPSSALQFTTNIPNRHIQSPSNQPETKIEPNSSEYS